MDPVNDNCSGMRTLVTSTRTFTLKRDYFISTERYLNLKKKNFHVLSSSKNVTINRNIVTIAYRDFIWLVLHTCKDGSFNHSIGIIKNIQRDQICCDFASLDGFCLVREERRESANSNGCLISSCEFLFRTSQKCFHGNVTSHLGTLLRFL